MLLLVSFFYLFQSTHLHEVWLEQSSKLFYRLKFQSTHLHEVWQKRVDGASMAICFNPHTYMRCDRAVTTIFDKSYVSIHTPTWGVTYGYKDDGSQDNVSIHTPTWGVTQRLARDRIHSRFQSTHLHEVWPVIIFMISAPSCFNPHTYMRCDNLQQKVYNMLNSFNPHTYMRCDPS